MGEKRKRTAIDKKIEKHRRTALRRFPLLFTLLATFGFVATLYGFEHIIDRIPLLKENPIIMLSVGIVTLLITGTLHKHLDT